MYSCKGIHSNPLSHDIQVHLLKIDDKPFCNCLYVCLSGHALFDKHQHSITIFTDNGLLLRDTLTQNEVRK